MSASLISAKEPDISIPQVRRIVVETKGAQIVQEESPAVSPTSHIPDNKMKEMSADDGMIDA